MRLLTYCFSRQQLFYITQTHIDAQHGTVYLTMSVNCQIYTNFYPNSKLTILTLHITTYHLLVVLFNYTLYGASELRIGGTKFPFFMCNALVSFIIKATVGAPCEPCMTCRSRVLHCCSHVYLKFLRQTNGLAD